MQGCGIRLVVLAGLVLLVTMFLPLDDASAKLIVDGGDVSRNKVYIRTDGLACYFCAYGLERAFKKTGRIAAFDMHMEEGVVEITPLRGEPLVDARQLRQYVHDAGFTPRWIRVELTGRFVHIDGKLGFEVAETEQRLPVHEDLEAVVAAAPDLGLPVRLKALGLEHEDAAFELSEVTYERSGRVHTGQKP